MSREKFRVGKLSRDKRIVHTKPDVLRDMKQAAKRRHRRRSSQALKGADLDTGDEIDILRYEQDMTGWDIA